MASLFLIAFQRNHGCWASMDKKTRENGEIGFGLGIWSMFPLETSHLPVQIADQSKVDQNDLFPSHVAAPLGSLSVKLFHTTCPRRSHKTPRSGPLVPRAFTCTCTFGACHAMSKRSRSLKSTTRATARRSALRRRALTPSMRSTRVRFASADAP